MLWILRIEVLWTNFQFQIIYFTSKTNHFSEITGSNWLSKEELEAHLVENLNDVEYGQCVAALDRLLAQPFSYLAKDFIMLYRKEFQVQMDKYMITKPQLAEDGTHFVTTYGGFFVIRKFIFYFISDLQILFFIFLNICRMFEKKGQGWCYH